METKFRLFGIRHLSPASSYHLLRHLEECKPKCVLIEAPSDAKEYLLNLALKGVIPPVALISYTQSYPIQTLLYPFTKYSPEYQAILWAVKNNCEVRFIDLPTTTLLGIKKQYIHSCVHSMVEIQNNTKYFGIKDYESFWESNFEHQLDGIQFQEDIATQALEVYNLNIEYDSSLSLLSSLISIREAYMHQQIRQTLDEGFSIDETLIIVGAIHLKGLQTDAAEMAQSDFKKLPSTETNISLMPYSYIHLSNPKHYEIKCPIPYYYEMLWDAIQQQDLESVPIRYCSEIVRSLREKGFNSSTASAIEAVKLAYALALMHHDDAPILRDLHDAAITCLGEGIFSSTLEKVVSSVDVGFALGVLPKGLSRTPIQDDLNLQLKRLKLERFVKPEIQTLNIDLRKSLNAKNGEVSSLGLDRSILLHRLSVLEIAFATQLDFVQNKSTWNEKWELKWTSQTEIDVIESNLKGETIEQATAFCLTELLQKATKIRDLSAVVRLHCECNLLDSFNETINNLQRMLVNNTDFDDLAYTARELSILIQYNDVRNLNLEPLNPILQQLYLQASLQLIQESFCNNEVAISLTESINLMEIIIADHPALLDSKIWYNELNKLAFRDDLNPYLSGIAFSILMDHKMVNEENFKLEIFRRLSSNSSSETGILWIEGLASRNRYMLINTPYLWKELDKYIAQLDDEQFTSCLVYLRRTLSRFDVEQKERIVELLFSIWGVETVIDSMEPVQTNHGKLDDLNNFDFDF